MSAPFDNRWTPWEIATLTARYPEGGYRAVREHLPGRSIKAVHTKAAHLGISAGIRRGRRIVHSPDDIAVAREYAAIAHEYERASKEFHSRLRHLEKHQRTYLMRRYAKESR